MNDNDCIICFENTCSCKPFKLNMDIPKEFKDIRDGEIQEYLFDYFRYGYIVDESIMECIK